MEKNVEILEYLHQQKYQNEKYLPRKLQLPKNSSFNLYGVRGAGKSAMIYELLCEVESTTTLYLDMEDPRLRFEALSFEQIQDYIDKHAINLLILDHFAQEMLSRLPTLPRLIVVTRVPLKSVALEAIELFLLDYEEFLAFEGGVSTANAFNHFLKAGTLPMMQRVQRSGNLKLKYFFERTFSDNEQNLLLLLAHYHTKPLTTHQIYTFAKERFKLSKDWLYRTIHTFEEEKLLYFIPDRVQKGGKKMLFFDFAFAKSLTLSQSFSVQFDAMVALALLQRRIYFETLGIYGYVTHHNELILPAPFENEETLRPKLHNKLPFFLEQSIEKITVVTVANSFEFKISGVELEALPYYEWSVVLEA